MVELLEPTPTSPDRPPTQTTLKVERLSVRFGGVHALADVCVDVESHTAVGVIGPNGAGKTTLLNAISGFVRTTSGRITLDGLDLSNMAATKRATSGLGRTFQTPRLFPGLTVTENLKVVERRGRHRSPVPISEALEITGARHLAAVAVENLQAGERRFVEIARTLMLSPSVVLLDEPATGLRDTEVTALTECLRTIISATGASILVISHDMRVINEACDSVVALDQGQVVTSGHIDDVRSDPRVVEAYFGSEVEQ